MEDESHDPAMAIIAEIEAWEAETAARVEDIEVWTRHVEDNTGWPQRDFHYFSD